MFAREIPFGEKLATLIVDGVEQEINYAVYGENAVLVLSDAFQSSPSDFTGRGREPYRAALVVQNGKVSENMTVYPALVGGSVSDTAMEGVRVSSTTSNFNHVIIENSDYTLSNCDLRADTQSDGKRVCDFDGYGSVICAYKGARLTIDHCSLFSRGVAKPVVFVDGGADCLIQDSTYQCEGGTLYAGYQNAAGFTKMVAPPWVLGITGTARGTNLMGPQSTMTIANCDCSAAGWGVVSTDGGQEMALYIVDSTLTLTPGDELLNNPYLRRYGSGYGIYCCGCDEFIHGTTFRVGTYAIISTGGSITLASSRGTITPRKKYLVPTGRFAPQPPDGHQGEVMDVHWYDDPVFPPITGKGRPTVIESDGWGFMFHGDSKLNMLDGTICNTDYATFLVRSCSVDLTVDDSTLNPGDGIILQMIDNDDKAVGGLFTPDIYDEKGNLIQAHTGPIFNHEFFEHPGYPGIDYQPVCQSGGGRVTAVFTNCHLSGDFYNATGFRNLGDGDRGQGEPLELTFGAGARITGIITSATAKHIDEKGKGNNLFTMEQYYYLGHVKNRPYDNGVNPVSVSLADDATWVVTGECLLSAISIGENAHISAPEGNALNVTVDGAEVTLASGNSYSGKIHMSLS